jgi:hypothetical protein
MTRLDYESARRRSVRSDFVGDDLPRTGSAADARRYFSKRSGVGPKADDRSCRFPTTPAPPRLPRTDQLLEHFCAAAESSAFATGHPWQRGETLAAIRKLVASATATRTCAVAPRLLARAHALLRRHAY